eukprot:767263-Hanusia_phi.AAC.13
MEELSTRSEGSRSVREGDSSCSKMPLRGTRLSLNVSVFDSVDFDQVQRFKLSLSRIKQFALSASQTSLQTMPVECTSSIMSEHFARSMNLLIIVVSFRFCMSHLSNCSASSPPAFDAPLAVCGCGSNDPVACNLG